jgi:hypothetical protein
MSEKRDWTEAEFAVLRGLWAEGLSASAIGGRMGRTKNSVLGCVHRLTLPGRASPIAAKGSGVAPKQQRRAALLGVGKVRGENSLAGGTLAALGVVPAGEVRLAPEPVALLADRRAARQGFPLLRRGRGAGTSLLRRALRSGLCGAGGAVGGQCRGR